MNHNDYNDLIGRHLARQSGGEASRGMIKELKHIENQMKMKRLENQ